MRPNACHVALATQPETNPSCPGWPASQNSPLLASTIQSPTRLAPSGQLARALLNLPRPGSQPEPYPTCPGQLANQHPTRFAPSSAASQSPTGLALARWLAGTLWDLLQHASQPEPYTTYPHSLTSQSPTHLAPAGQTARALPKTCSGQLTSQSPGPLALASQHPT